MGFDRLSPNGVDTSPCRINKLARNASKPPVNPSSKMPSAMDTLKHREIAFAALPPGQTTQALSLLGGLGDLVVAPLPDENTLSITYSLRDYTLEGLESALISQGFHLDNSLLHKLVRALIYYCEEVQSANLTAPELAQQTRRQEIFTRAYEHHPHGDKDETPEEWREYK